MNSILITGCNRGLGLGLVKCLMKNNAKYQIKHIFATCRNKQEAVELQELADLHKNIHLLEIDLHDFDKYSVIVDSVKSIVKDDGLNVLFNNAGAAPKSTRLPFVKAQDLIDTYLTNTVAPIMFTKAFYDLLKIASKKNADKPMGIQRATIINMSSILGSIEANVDGGLYAYRATKSGLNAATKSMSIDMRENKIVCVSMHPGWVRTRLGGAKAPLDVDDACQHITNTMLTLNEKHNGKFIQYDGKPLPW